MATTNHGGGNINFRSLDRDLQVALPPGCMRLGIRRKSCQKSIGKISNVITYINSWPLGNDRLFVNSVLKPAFV